MSELRNDIALAAFASTPRLSEEDDRQWLSRVAVNAGVIATNLDPDHSPVMAHVKNVEEANVFTATITQVFQDPRAPRYVIYTFSQKGLESGEQGARYYDEQLPPGYEYIRTPSMFEGEVFAHVARQAMSLIGHRVGIWRSKQPMEKNGKKLTTRVAVHIKDYGVDENFTVEYAPNEQGIQVPVRATPIGAQ